MTRKADNWLSRRMPTREGLEANRFLKPFAHRFLRSELWRFTRRSVPRGVALGMLAGFWIPVGQFLVAAIFALPVRANVPVACVTTLITNPLTYPAWIVAAKETGDFILRLDAYTYGQPLASQVAGGFGDWLSSFLKYAAVTAFSFAVLGVLFAAIGYLVSSFGWRLWIGRKRKTRLENHRARLAKKQKPAPSA